MNSSTGPGFLILLFLIFSFGCSLFKSTGQLPGKRQFVHEQLTVYSDFYLPSTHPIIEELASLRHGITEALEIPTSEQPIHIYLFENEERLRKFAQRQLPGFPPRRAFFIKKEDQLMVWAFWGEKIAEDIRHEVTHAYVHSVVPNVPIWLDEGIAEYFEVSPVAKGVNEPHIRLLADSYRQETWRPDLERLEGLSATAELSQLEYAEAWLWIHFLLTSDAYNNSLICQSLRQLRETGSAAPIFPQVRVWMPDWEQKIILHLKRLAEEL
jgi:hypothetical protein